MSDAESRHAPDVTSPAFKAEPGPVCRHLREDVPVARVDVPGMKGGAYVISRYEDAAAALRDERLVKDVRSARDPRHSGMPWVPPALAPLAHTMLDSDGEEHHRLRSLVRDTFAPRYVAALEPRVIEIVDARLDAMAAAGRADLVAGLALPVPLTLISEILGVPEADRMRFQRWFRTLVDASARSASSLRMLLKLPDILAMMRFLRRLVEDARTHPRDDLVSRIAAVEEDGDRLTGDELLAMVAILLIAGYETTVNLIASGTLLLLTHPDQLDRLRREPDLIASAVEELLRLATPVDVATERYAREDVEIAGTVIPRGSLVLVAIVAANADPARFHDPERLDLGRTENRHLGFGMGVHYCLGAPLARLEGRVAIGALIRRFPALRLAVPAADLRWRPALSLRALRELPVELG